MQDCGVPMGSGDPVGREPTPCAASNPPPPDRFHGLRRARVLRRCHVLRRSTGLSRFHGVRRFHGLRRYHGPRRSHGKRRCHGQRRSHGLRRSNGEGDSMGYGVSTGRSWRSSWRARNTITQMLARTCALQARSRIPARLCSRRHWPIAPRPRKSAPQPTPAPNNETPQAELTIFQLSANPSPNFTIEHEAKRLRNMWFPLGTKHHWNRSG